MKTKITLKNYQLNVIQAEFFNETFFLGLQEFACRNQLDLRKKINFPISSKTNLFCLFSSTNARIRLRDISQ